MSDDVIVTVALHRTSEFGVIRLEYWPEGISLWVRGQMRWASWKDPKLKDVRWDQYPP